ncbi:MAG: butyrate kinase [candidate division KSB1 bacterium]|nr:butyrate kinase [candidate division KSB1 bacterium]MDZ7276301.1 butyrate kinase [candidate division KSB1 bacterium]MDZ7287746.1 butyrate kinase [candidate division KSB1 bacterium]MDZ7299914.1 butyrate kinase [candidate division KSB1 bacterium]MDZ7308374.1 butyrate kinase [candidate division KSB1 bacterium]
MAKVTFKILVLNPGSTSTKLAHFENEQATWTETIRHREAELAPFARQPMRAQLQFRLAAVREILQARTLDLQKLDAIAGRGGLLKPLASGTYRVNEAMLADLRQAARGEHASNLGAFLAHELAAQAGCPAFIVDPVSVDEWPPVARLSGLAGLERECLSHALNTKAIAKRFAAEQGRGYGELRLIVAHLGSGISISAHEHGRMIDVTNSREEGAFSTERAGSLPVMKLVELCFSGKFSRQEIETRIFREGGLYSYLNTKDLLEVLRRCQAGEEQAQIVYEAMIYQISKEIGAMAAVLAGRVDAILLTGGMVHAPGLVDALTSRVQWIAPVFCYPGEDELQALAEGALRVLRGQEAALDYA